MQTNLSSFKATMASLSLREAAGRETQLQDVDEVDQLNKPIAHRSLSYDEAANVLGGFKSFPENTLMDCFPIDVLQSSSYVIDFKNIKESSIDYRNNWIADTLEIRNYILKKSPGSLPFLEDLGDAKASGNDVCTVNCKQAVRKSTIVGQSFVRSVYSMVWFGKVQPYRVVTYGWVDEFPDELGIHPAENTENGLSVLSLDETNKQHYYGSHVLFSTVAMEDEKILEVLLAREQDMSRVCREIPQQYRGRGSFLVPVAKLPTDTLEGDNGLWVSLSKTTHYYLNIENVGFVQISEKKCRDQFQGICDFKIVQIIEENYDRPIHFRRKITRVDANLSMLKMYPFAMITYDCFTPTFVET